MIATDLAFWGIISHLFIDWFLQNEWIANNKTNILHVTAWIHGLTHFIGMLTIFPPMYAFLIAIIHILIDTRYPLNWWRKVYRQTITGDIALHVAIWEDQVAHMIVICLCALLKSL